VEAAPRLDRRAHDDELGAALGRDAGDFLGQAAGTGAHDLAAHADAVRARHRFRRLEPLLQADELAVEMRVQRKLALEDGRSDQNDAGAAIGGEPAGQIERVLRLLRVQQRYDDAPIGDRPRQARKTLRPAPQQPDVGQPHRRRGYGTEARITCGSTIRSRLT
jgi:hypothetical protein